MLQKINETIDVITIYKHIGAIVFPYKIKWRNREYKITKVGYHHKEKVGKTLFHIFHVVSATLAFRLRFDPNNLHWILEEVSDGLAN